MPINSRFLAARAAERRYRDMAHLRGTATLQLRRAGQPLSTVRLTPLTLRHLLEFRLRGNAFFTGRPVRRGDVFSIIWRLSLLYRSPIASRERLVGDLSLKRFRVLRLWAAFGSWISALEHRRLSRLASQCDLPSAAEAVSLFLVDAQQDAPTSNAGARRGRAAPERSFADNQTDFLMSTYGMSHDAALDFPVALANQLYRDRLFNLPDADINIAAPSDCLLSGKSHE